MSILNRFKNIMTSNINALLDKAENPEKMIDQCLRDLNSDLGKVKSETAAIMAEEQRSRRVLEECNQEITKMETFAVKALESGNEGDARKFLEQKASLTSKQSGLQQSFDISSTNAASMRQMHDKLVSDIGQLESRKDMIKGKLAVAKTQERVNKMGSSVAGANSTIAGFQKYEAMADNALDKANAMAELNASSSNNDIDDLTAKYSASSSVDDELANLKAKLNQ